ncbi:MAG: hypothetical protein IJD17_06780 [Clostridia bacterium]|nr:hypothetical protein [Clostridia bacterium]
MRITVWIIRSLLCFLIESITSASAPSSVFLPRRAMCIMAFIFEFFFDAASGKMKSRIKEITISMIATNTGIAIFENASFTDSGE